MEFLQLDISSRSRGGDPGDPLPSLISPTSPEMAQKCPGSAPEIKAKSKLTSRALISPTSAYLWMICFFSPQTRAWDW